MSTEARNPNTGEIDRASTLDILRLINAEDATVPGVVRDVLPAIAAAVDAVVAQLRRGGRLFYAGAGTSGRLAMLDAVECVPTFGTPPELVQALVAGGPAAMVAGIEGAEDEADTARREVAARGVDERDILIGVAASGRTPYVIGALEEARSRGAITAAISCNAPAPILERADYPIPLVTGPEVVAGSTRLKAGTAQKLTLNMISTASMIRLGKVYGNRMVDLRVTNVKLHERAAGMVAELLGVGADEAERLLVAGGLEVRTAVLMGMFGLTAESANHALDQAGGVLRAAIEVVRANG